MEITEKAVKERVKKIIEIFKKYYDIYTFCPMAFGYADSGHPDRILLLGGKFLGIEVKKDEANYHFRRNTRKPTKSEAAQAARANEIELAGGDWMCVCSTNLWSFVQFLYNFPPLILRVDFRKEDDEKLKKLTEFK